MFERSAFWVGATTFVVSIASLSTAGVADGPFISLLVGGAETEDVAADDVNVEFDTGFAIAGQFGYQFDAFRLGGELGYQIAEGLSDTNVDSELGITRFTLTGYVDLPIAPRVGPYLGGGFGVANLSTGDDLGDDFEDEDTAFTWHGEVGLNIGLTDQFSVAPVYRYQWIDSDIGGQTEPLVSHIFGVSLRYQFPSRHRSDNHSEPAYRSGGERYDSGYTSYGSRDRYDRYDRYDRDDHHHHDGRKKRRKTPEELERDRCGWKGLGCEDE